MTPAVSHVGCVSAGGGSGIRQPRHGVSPGRIASICPSAPTQPPNTHGLPVGHGVVVEQIARLEVVRAVDDQVDVVGQRANVRGRDVGDDRLDGDGRVDLAQPPRRGDGLGQLLGDVGFVEQHLAVQVVGLEKVAVDDPHEADAGAHEQIGRHAAQGAATADEHARREQPPLPFFAERREAHLAAVAIKSCSSTWTSDRPRITRMSRMTKCERMQLPDPSVKSAHPRSIISIRERQSIPRG